MPNYSNYNDWLDDLESDAIGNLWLMKFKFDIAKGNLLPAVESTVRQIVDNNLSDIAPLPSPLSVIDYILKEAPTLFDLQCQRFPTLIEPFSCIVKLDVYGRYLLKRRVFSTLLDDADDDLDFIWDNLGDSSMFRYHDGELRTEREFFWCTPTDRLEELDSRYTPNKAATVIRTRLGLDHMSKGQRIVRIDIAPSLLSGKKIRAPTALDGGSNPVFVPSNETDGYGRALNLRTVKRDLKEVIVEKVPFTPAFSVKRQGRVSARIPSVNFSAIELLLVATAP